ncbi:uncharacterized protein LOC133183879 [Saccostrea echinata]|uniref:uncharacterized protein LOC133183879 n=1 Tax=Saccostrea echinata TaxID=191078 RepID=UPI002A830FE6|nr:uncharacterized protein LOC133183879 [Saccostrea echinata]
MKSPTKGNFTPDFFESECSINFPDPSDTGIGPALRALSQGGIASFAPEGHTSRSLLMRAEIESECSDVPSRRGNGGNMSSNLGRSESRAKSSSSKSVISLSENKKPTQSKNQERTYSTRGSGRVSSCASIHTESAPTPRTASVVSGYIANSDTPVRGQRSVSITSANSQLDLTIEEKDRTISPLYKSPASSYATHCSDNIPRSLASQVSVKDNSSSRASISGLISPKEYELSGCSSMKLSTRDEIIECRSPTPHSSPVIGRKVSSDQEVSMQEKMIKTKVVMRKLCSEIPKPVPSESPTKSCSFNKFKQIPTGTTMKKRKNGAHGRQGNETDKTVKGQKDGRAKGKCNDTFNVPNKGEKKAVDTGKEAKKKVKPAVAKAKEEDVEVKLTALERRKAYEAKRKAERVKKAESKMNVKKQASEPPRGRKMESKTGVKKLASDKTQMNITDNNKRNMEGKQSKQPGNKIKKAADDCNYEDDFESDDEEIRLTDPKVVNSQKIEAHYQKSEDEVAMTSAQAANRKQSGRLNGDDHHGDYTKNVPHLNILTPREVQDLYLDMYYQNSGQMSGRANPNSARSDVDFEYLNHQHTAALKQSTSSYSPMVRNPQYEYTCPMARDIRKELGYGTMVLDYNQVARRNAGREDIPSYENGQYFVKPNPRKKTTVGYVPGYGAVKVPTDSGQADVKKRNHYPSYTVYHVDGTVSNPRKKNVAGYVPGYGPVRCGPVPTVREVSSGRVVLPPLHPMQNTRQFQGDIRAGRQGQGKRKTLDVLESRAKAKPFNTYVDEEASRRFERQFSKRY